MTDSTDRPTIVEFIQARLAEDEAIARAATRRMRPWVTREDEVYELGDDFDSGSRCSEHLPGIPNNCDDEPIADAVDVSDVLESKRATHIARHDPPRVLRHCALHRKLLEQYASAKQRFPDPDDQTTRDGIETMAWFDLLRVQLRYVAAVWSDHPDYRTEWAA